MTYDYVMKAPNDWVAALDKALNGMMTVRMHARYEEDKEFAIRFTAIWFELIEKKRLASAATAQAMP
jgi:hypothetical protein